MLFFVLQGPSASAYVTYIRSEDALRAIQCVNNVVVDGRTLKVTRYPQSISSALLLLFLSLRSDNKTIILENNARLLHVFQASLGTTKYCSYFLKSMQCPKPDCMYLHELGDEAASFTKEEMQVKKKNMSVFLQS